MNSLNKWPHVHVCLLSLDCWCEWWLYGAPFRIHYKKKDWTIPGPLLWIADHKHDKMWSGAIQVTRGPDSELTPTGRQDNGRREGTGGSEGGSPQGGGS